METAVTITCAPKAKEGERRVSFNFSTVQLPKEKFLKWQIITHMEEQNDIRFTIMQEGSLGQHHVYYENMSHGTITTYEGLRNLYVALPQNATGHFLLKVEACSGEA